MRRAGLSAVLVATALCAAACAGTQPVATSVTSSSGPTNALTSLKACSLLTDDEAQQVAPGVGGGTELGVRGGAGTSDCKWYQPSTNEAVGISFGITVRPAARLEDGAKVPEVRTTGGHQAKLVKTAQGEGACILAVLEIAVGSGRVDLNAEAGPTDDACAVANKLSDLVEPKLPAS